MVTNKKQKINKIKKALEDTGCLCEIKENKLIISNCEYYSTLTVAELLKLIDGFKVTIDLQIIPLNKRK